MVQKEPPKSPWLLTGQYTSESAWNPFTRRRVCVLKRGRGSRIASSYRRGWGPQEHPPNLIALGWVVGEACWRQDAMGAAMLQET